MKTTDKTFLVVHTYMHVYEINTKGKILFTDAFCFSDGIYQVQSKDFYIKTRS